MRGDREREQRIDELIEAAERLYRSAPADALELASKAVRLATIRKDTARTARALYLTGASQSILGNYPSARTRLVKALALSREVGDRATEAAVLQGIGTIHTSLGEYRDAMLPLDEALAITVACGEGRTQASIHNSIGTLYSCICDYPRALEQYHRAHALFEAASDQRGMFFALNNIGTVYLALNDLERAAERFQQMAECVHETGDPRCRFVNDFNLGTVAHRLGDFQVARDYYLRALDLGRELGDRSSQTEIMRCVGVVYQDLGEFDFALDYLEQTRAVAEEMDDPVRNQQLELDMEHRAKELTTLALHLVEKSQFLGSLKTEMEEATRAVDGNARPLLRGLARQVEGKIDRKENRQTFQAQFEKVHEGFTQTLRQRCAALTPTELKVCALLKIGMSSKEIGDILALSARTIDNHRHHIRKKFAMEDDQDLGSYLAML